MMESEDARLVLLQDGCVVGELEASASSGDGGLDVGRLLDAGHHQEERSGREETRGDCGEQRKHHGVGIKHVGSHDQ